MTLNQTLVNLAIKSGAYKAEVIPQKQVVLSESFYDICKSNTCGQFGRNFMCPPDVGEVSLLMEKVRAYPHVLIYQTVSQLEDSFDWEGMQAAGKHHVQLSQRLKAELTPFLPQGSLHLSRGGCGLCEVCAKTEDLPCRFPADAMPSVESHGVDVYNTVKDTPLKYINGPNTVTFFGMICFKENGYAPADNPA